MFSIETLESEQGAQSSCSRGQKRVQQCGTYAASHWDQNPPIAWMEGVLNSR